MIDIFLSYKSKDRPRAKIIIETLERNGYNVWWDRVIPPGKKFDEFIQEASEGLRREILIPILIDDINIPLGFKRTQAANLVDWQGNLPHPEFSLLLRSIGDITGKPATEISDAEKYRIVQSFQLKNVEEIKSALQYYGPVVAACPVYESMDTDSVKKTGIIPDPGPDEKTIGAHSICLVGFDDEKKLFKFKNSWSMEWGDNGYEYISYDYIKKYASDTWIFWI